MYKKDNKTYYEWSDFEDCIQVCGVYIENETRKVHIVTLYRGGLPLGVRLSNEYNLPLSILDYQSYNGNSKEVSMMKNAGICSSDVLYLVDDIMDSGNSIKKAKEFLNKEFPDNKIEIFTIFGSNKKFQGTSFQYVHDKEWIIFKPWERE